MMIAKVSPEPMCLNIAILTHFPVTLQGAGRGEGEINYWWWGGEGIKPINSTKTSKSTSRKNHTMFNQWKGLEFFKYFNENTFSPSLTRNDFLFLLWSCWAVSTSSLPGPQGSEATARPARQCSSGTCWTCPPLLGDPGAASGAWFCDMRGCC